MAGGRPTKYKAEFAEQAEKLCKKGFTNEELGEFFNVETKTINNWMNAHDEFLHALKSGKRYSDDKVVSALYNRALGYEFLETKEESGDSGAKITVTTKQQAGDTTAQIFWLKNRDPENWRAAPIPDSGNDITDKLNININVVDASKNAES